MTQDGLKNQNKKRVKMAAKTPCEAHEQKITQHEERLQALERTDAARVEQIKNLYETVGEIKQMVSDIRIDLAALKEKPAKRWDTLIAYTIGAVVTAIISYLVGVRL